MTEHLPTPEPQPEHTPSIPDRLPDGIVSPAEVAELTGRFLFSRRNRQAQDQNNIQATTNAVDEVFSRALRPSDIFTPSGELVEQYTAGTSLDRALAGLNDPTSDKKEQAQNDLQAIEGQLTEIATYNSEAIDVLNTLHYMGLDKVNKRIAEKQGKQFRPRSYRAKTQPEGHMAATIVREFADPAELIAKYKKNREADRVDREKFGMDQRSPQEVAAMDSALDSLMTIMYGNRYEQYKAENAKNTQEAEMAISPNEQVVRAVRNEVDSIFKNTAAEARFGDETQLIAQRKVAEEQLGVEFADQAAFNRVSALHFPEVDNIEIKAVPGLTPGQIVSVEGEPWTYLGIDPSGEAMVATWDDESNRQKSRLYPPEYFM